MIFCIQNFINLQLSMLMLHPKLFSGPGRRPVQHNKDSHRSKIWHPPIMWASPATQPRSYCLTGNQVWVRRRRMSALWYFEEILQTCQCFLKSRNFYLINWLSLINLFYFLLMLLILRIVFFISVELIQGFQVYTSIIWSMDSLCYSFSSWQAVKFHEFWHFQFKQYF